MCFRPSTVEQSLNCPECGKKINAIGGRIPHICPFCEADISDLAKSMSTPVVASPFANNKKAADVPLRPDDSRIGLKPKAPQVPTVPKDSENPLSE